MRPFCLSNLLFVNSRIKIQWLKNKELHEAAIYSDPGGYLQLILNRKLSKFQPNLLPKHLLAASQQSRKLSFLPTFLPHLFCNRHDCTF